MKKIAFLMASAATGELSGELERREKILRTIADPDTMRRAKIMSTTNPSTADMISTKMPW